MTIAQALTNAQAQAHVDVPDRAAIQAKMESTRAAYHQLLNSLTETEHQRPLVTSKWTVKEIMCHMVIVLEDGAPMLIDKARKGREMPKFFDSLVGNWLNYKQAVWSARKATPESLAQRYDTAHQQLLTLLEGVADHEWALTSAYPDGTPVTMAGIFHMPTWHFELHSGWVHETLDR